jgi:hypothetical protein
MVANPPTAVRKTSIEPSGDQSAQPPGASDSGDWKGPKGDPFPSEPSDPQAATTVQISGATSLVTRPSNPSAEIVDSCPRAVKRSGAGPALKVELPDRLSYVALVPILWLNRMGDGIGERNADCAGVSTLCDLYIGPQGAVLTVTAGDYAIYPGRQIRSGNPPLSTTTTTHADVEQNYRREGGTVG